MMHGSSRHAYPGDLAQLVQERAQAQALPLGVDLAQLTDVLSVAYQASLLREEERATTFRLLLARADTISHDVRSARGPLPLRFDEPRVFTADELRRLSQAAKFQRSVIALDIREGRPQIWGILHTGPAWLRSVQGGRGETLDPLPGVQIAVAGPGRLSVSHQGQPLGQLMGGRLVHSTHDVFRSPWLGEVFAPARQSLVDEHARERISAWSHVDPALIRMVGQHFVRRIISTIRVARHGGAVVVLPDTCANAIANGPHIKMKFAFADEEPRRRFRALLLSAMRTLAAQGDAVMKSDTVGWETYNRTRDEEIERIDEAIFELSHLVASLADVDGSVVLNTRFELLGFGAEIGVGLDEVRAVARAIDLDGADYQMERADGVGTRHRSMYRLANRYPEALGIVVSQDGGVRFIRRREERVTYWDQGGASTAGL